jgi:hypothetical protein
MSPTETFKPDQEPVTVTLHQAGELVETAVENNGHLWLLGPSGCGKTMMVKQSVNTVAERLGKTYKIIYRNPAMEDTIDNRGALVGLATGEPRFEPIGEFREIFDDGYDPVAEIIVVFLDDFTNAPEPIQKAYMPLLLNNREQRFVQGMPVRDSVVFIVAGNRRKDKSGVRGVLHAVTGRADVIVEILPEVDEWIIWAIQEELPWSVIGCVKWNREIFCVDTPNVDMKKIGNPRNWAALGYVVRDWNVPDHLEYQTYTGAVGQSEAQQFISFREVQDDLPDIDMILLDPENALIPQDNPGAMWATCANLCQVANLDNFEAIVTYTDRMRDREFGVFTIQNVVRAAEELTSTKTYIDWTQRNKGVRY